MNRLIPLILLCGLLLPACGPRSDAISTRSEPEPATAAASGAGAGAAPAPGPAAVDDPGLNLLVLANGEVTLKRRQWSDYFPITFGSELHRGDLLRVDNSGNALVLCDGLTTWEVPAGAPAGLNNGCPSPPEAILKRGDSLVGNTRGGNNPLIPYVILPRKTLLLNATPLLKWHPVPGATSYSVRVRGGDIDWSTTTEATELRYPGEPPLQSGTTYALLVDANTGASSREEGVPGLGFTLMDDATAREARDGIERIEALALSEQAHALAITQFMVGMDLLAESLEVLEDSVDAGETSPAISRMRGVIYRQMGLDLLAAETYESALASLPAGSAVELEADIKARLADVYSSLGNTEATLELLRDAIAVFETLGDVERAAELQSIVDSLGG